MERPRSESAPQTSEHSSETVPKVVSSEVASESETVSVEEDFAPSNSTTVERAYAEGWEHERQIPEIQDYLQEKEEYSEAVRQWDVYIESLMTAEENGVDPQELERSLNTREVMKNKLVEVSANYPGDWTGLLYRRMTDPISKEKFVSQRTEALPAMKEGVVPEEYRNTKFEKKYQQHYQTQVDDYDERVASIFGHTNIDPSVNKTLGHGNINMPGTVYLNAIQKDDSSLSARQKNIIEAHEKGHGLRDFHSPTDIKEVLSVLDVDTYNNLMTDLQASGQEGVERYRSIRNYLKDPAEIIERMGQFKNYFGMQATEPFTKKHLDYVREHYVTDTKLDNSVGDLLHCVTPKTEAAFLTVINKYPI